MRDVRMVGVAHIDLATAIDQFIGVSCKPDLVIPEKIFSLYLQTIVRMSDRSTEDRNRLDRLLGLGRSP